MKKYITYFLLILPMFTLLSCQKSKQKNKEIDKNSYINDFELLQENPRNDYSIKITSPKAVIDSLKNDIEIFDSSIELISKKEKDLLVLSGNSTLNNSLNLIRVFNNVNISLLENKGYFIKTDSFNWDLNTSNIDFDSPLDINFEKTNIIASDGSYNIKSGILSINNNYFSRSIFNNEGKQQYNIEIISDNAKWLKNSNTLEFKSKDKQVESKINFLSVK